MTDEFEDRLRDHLAGRAARVQVDPDPSSFVEHAAGRTRRRSVVAGGVAALTVVVAGAGLLAGVNLSGTTSAAQPQSSVPATGAGRAGADLAPTTGSQVPPSIVVQTPYTFLFTRVTSSGVTIRAYTDGSTTTGCSPAVTCTPTTTVPPIPSCPTGALCAQPVVTPHTAGSSGSSSGSSGSSGDAASGSGGVAVPDTSTTTAGATSPPNQPVGSGSTGSGPTGSGTTGSGPAGSGTTSTDPTQTPGSCQPLILELSNDKAVGTGSVSLPDTVTASPDTVEVLGTGSFGTVEGAPVGWVAVWVGSGVTSVQLSVGGTAVDAMAPDGGVVVLATSNNAGLDSASVVGLDQSGATVASAPAGQVAAPDGVSGCPAPISTTPTAPTTTTTTTTTVPGGSAPTSTTTTTVSGAPVPLPAPTNRPVTTPASDQPRG
jgi:hypothetical protein